LLFELVGLRRLLNHDRLSLQKTTLLLARDHA
jgi:hypothetical protein